MCINGKWIKDDQLKTNKISNVTENSTLFFAMSVDGSIYVNKKGPNSSWSKIGNLPTSEFLINANDTCIVACGDRMNAYLSYDFGKSWKNLPVTDRVHSCYLSTDALLFATNVGLYRLVKGNLSELFVFPDSGYIPTTINQYKDEIIVVAQDIYDSNMMPLYIFYSPNNGADFIKLNLVVKNNFQLWSPFNVYVYDGVIYLISLGIKETASNFIFSDKNFLHTFNVKK